MCLDKIEKTGLKLTGSGYKVVKLRSGGFDSPFWGDRNKVYRYGEWIKDSNTNPEIGYDKYKPGFHIFTEYPGTMSIFSSSYYLIKRVEFRGGHTSGYDFGLKTTVCTEMKLKKYSFTLWFNKIILNKLFRRK